MEKKAPSDREPKTDVARRVYISDIVSQSAGEPPNATEHQLSRVRVFGLVTMKKLFRGEGRLDYAVLSVDDGSGTAIRVKAWGKDTGTLDAFDKGDSVDIVGRVRYAETESYILPEIVRRIDDPNWEIVRELENIDASLSQKRNRVHVHNSSDGIPPDPRSEILGIIDKADEYSGIDYNELIRRVKHYNEDEIKKALRELLSKGTICEPRPGRYRR